MNLLLVDDHALVRAGLSQLLGTALGAAVAEAGDAETALAMLERLTPDVVVVDLNLPGMGGLALIPLLKRQGLRVLALSMHTEPLYASRALDSGAAGYASKHIAPEMLVEAVRLVARGQRFIEPGVAQAIALRQIDADGRMDRLSARDLEIIRSLAAGRSLSEIAASLDVSYKTVANLVSAIRVKAGAPRTADLIRMGLEMQGFKEGQGSALDPLGGAPPDPHLGSA